MQFSILGPVEARLDGRAIEITRPKELLLLSVLLLRANELVSTDRLANELWPQGGPAKKAEAIQELVYQLRRKLERDLPARSVLGRDGDGYRIVVAPGGLDLHRFERLVRQGLDARREGELQQASSTIAEAVSIWRGPPLANVTVDHQTAARADVARLEELRLGAVIARIEVDLALGDEEALVGELEELIAENPLDERLRGLLMLALYRAGRQADALAVYRNARAALDELGLEPGRMLRELEQQILCQDPALDRPIDEVDDDSGTGERTAGERAVIVAAFAEGELEPLLAVAEPLAQSQLGRELVLSLVVPPEDDALARATAVAGEHRARLIDRGTDARAAAFTSTVPADDVVRLANRRNVDLVLASLDSELLDHGRLGATTEALLACAPCDVALVSARGEGSSDGPVVVPFGGYVHDWGALELGAWAAMAFERPLTLLGSTGPGGAARDASRLLADASLLVQDLLGIAAGARLVEPAPEDILRAAEGASLLVVGVPESWPVHGLGTTRLELARGARSPVVFVRKGARPGGLAPRDTSVFAWSLTNVDAGARATSGVAL
jgi:DNA-binding SARP family transcriptional activator